MALQIQSSLLPSRAMGEGNVVICDIVEEVNFVPVECQASSDRVHRSIAPTLVEETTILVESFKVVEIRRRPKPVQISDFEIGPL
jgi:hypothetical protein